MKNEIVLPEIDYGCYRAIDVDNIDVPLNVYERDLLKLAEKTFSSGDLETLAIVKASDSLKVIRSRKSYIFQTLTDEEFSSILSDYDAYLNFLFVHDIETAHITDANKAIVELMIKTLVSYFEVNVSQKQDDRVVNIYDGVHSLDHKHTLFFRPEDIRPSFNADFLKRVQRLMKKDVPSENSKNKIGIEHIGQSLKNNPRPKMKILELDPYITGSID